MAQKYNKCYIRSHLKLIIKENINRLKSRMKMLQKPLTIFIVGTTAVGKTKLSIQLCKALNGQVINCDSKQLYKHANIMTAKATPEQIQGVPHHMLSVLDLAENCYNRNKYFEEATRCINDIQGRGKVPVVIGGTNYYLETLLYDIEIKEYEQNGQSQKPSQNQKIKLDKSIDNNELQQQQKSSPVQSRLSKAQVQKMSKSQKYAYLLQVDPVMAQKLHKNDQTRISSFLSRYCQTGIPPSLSYKPYIHKLRYKDSILFWLRNSDRAELHGLMEKRIGKMVEGDGFIEIMAIFKYADQHGLLGGKMGALQSIGYKEFQELYQQVRDVLQDEQFDNKNREYHEIQQFIKQRVDKIKQKMIKITSKSIKSHKNIPIFQKCKQILIKNTIDYSKRQITWIKNRLFSCEANQNNFFVLELQNKFHDGADLATRFDKEVKNRAIQIVTTINQQGFGSVKQNIKYFNTVKHEGLNEWKKYFCQQCHVQANGSLQWTQHLNSRKHKLGMTKKQRKREIMKQKKKMLRGQDSDNENSSNELDKQSQKEQQEQQQPISKQHSKKQ